MVLMKISAPQRLCARKTSFNQAVEDNSVTRSALHSMPHFDVRNKKFTFYDFRTSNE